MLSFITWTVNPEFLHIGPIAMRWYGLLWAVGFILGYYFESKIYDREGLPKETMDKLFMYMIVGTILGARLGHCFFYEWDHFTSNPIELLYIWKGGLSSHGGAFGILTAMFIFSRKIKKSYIWVLDRLIIAVAICGACIRLGNLMNHEIYGDPTTMPWAFSFMLHPLHEVSAMSEPSHPTQIYEILYCLITFGVTLFLYWKTEARKHEGLIFGVFLIGVFFTRFMLEFIKRPQEDFEGDMLFNMGQLLSVPFFVVGICLVAYNIYKWNSEVGGSKPMAYAWIAAMVCFFAVLIVVPTVNRKNALSIGGSVAENEVEEVSFKPVSGMSADECIEFMAGQTFVSEYGLEMCVKGGYFYLQGQKFAGPLAPKSSSVPGQYYILAKGVDEGKNHYVLRAYENGKSVLINVDDVRGNYHVKNN